ncbi:MAG: hypothetical protein KDK70_21155 [Myxococcales bacterium]|nr:hypothetical protein [Myxococcales bacterium]
MAGFPLTAWALRHPWGSDVDAVLDRLHGSPRTSATEPPPPPGDGPLPALLDELGPRCAQTRARWGASRVAVVLGAGSGGSLAPQLAALQRTRQALGLCGPAFVVADGGAKAIAAADRLLRASLADAVLAGSADEDRGALLMIERHGHAFVELRASAEATAPALDDEADRTTLQAVLGSAWAAAGRPPLGCVLTPRRGPSAAADHEALLITLGAVPCCSTRLPSEPARASDGAIDAVLAAASLLRGYVPQPAATELEHDRVLTHAEASGHHVALLLEARP